MLFRGKIGLETDGFFNDFEGSFVKLNKSFEFLRFTASSHETIVRFSFMKWVYETSFAAFMARPKNLLRSAQPQILRHFLFQFLNQKYHFEEEINQIEDNYKSKKM